jgi:hypothetical protein
MEAPFFLERVTIGKIIATQNLNFFIADVLGSFQQSVGLLSHL